MPSQPAIATRPGSRPTTTPRTPHLQLDQHAPAPLQAELLARLKSLAHTQFGASHVSAPTSLALHLAAPYAVGPAAAFLALQEFAHLHGDGSGSLHLALPEETAREAIASGWAEHHPAVAAGFAPPTLVMVYGPRDQAGLEQVWTLVERSYAFARGQ